MSGPLYNWLYHGNLSSRAKMTMLFIVLLLLVGGSGGGVWYYLHMKAVREAEQKAAALAAVQQKKAAVTAFYTEALTGSDVKGFLQLYQEIVRSRLPIEMAGFNEQSFTCNTDSCSFSYKARDRAVFSVQQKRFHGTDYAPSFSQESVDYGDIPSAMNSNPLLEAFRAHRPVSQPVCNDLLNYLYSYNSLAKEGQRFVLASLPASSVTAEEESLPGNPENYGLLAGKWQVKLPDEPYVVLSFWQRRPYSSSFIFQSVNSQQGSLELSGTFLCKK